MQGLICLLGQHTVFEGASEILKRMLGIEFSAKQIQRVSEWYGNQIDPIIEANHISYMPQLPQRKEDESTYVMVDGSMVCTREEKWKEMKLARVFHESHNVDIQEGRNEITESIYVSHLGSVNEFCPKLERHLSAIPSRKVFVADGAKWIWNWVEDNYPGAVQILDYYHAVEKIEDVARLHYSDEDQRNTWLHEQKKYLLDDKVSTVIQNLKNIKPNNTEASQARETAIHYYLEHEDRMLYKTFRSRGLLIGSGPIEAAHRSVVHQRLKLSGQRWSIKGAQAIANLRCYHQSGAWNIVEDLIRLAA
jgi:hypothetical protein